ncbi:MAG: DM13 domain-containing protein [Deltaproteobacteria bacterium]|nr:DM13 domain-containing protein [Deltaproteobacteria bacterium]
MTNSKATIPCNHGALLALRSMAVSVIAVATMTFAGCADDDGPVDPNIEFSDGERVFSEPLPDGNTFTCSTCHAIEEPADDGFIRPGHALGGSTRRASYKNGQLTQMLDAVNSCQVEWMNADPWGPNDPAWLSLFEFLDGTAGAGEEVDIQIVPPAVDLAGGDAEAGREFFDGACAVCHGRGGIGTQLGPPVAMRGLGDELIARRVRSSGRADSDVYDGLTGGIMPFWAADRISDDQLRDVVAWITSTGAPDGSGGSNPGGGERGCGVTHPMVGAVAELVGSQHDVAGTATIIDDCTIQIENFVFDGGGIDVRVYGGLDGNYDDGFAIGEDLTGPGFAGETVTVQLDESMTLDDLDGISIWCVPVGVDFGSAFFELP